MAYGTCDSSTMASFSSFELPLLAYNSCVIVQGGGIWRGVLWNCNGLRTGSSEGTAQCDTPPEGPLRL